MIDLHSHTYAASVVVIVLVFGMIIARNDR